MADEEELTDTPQQRRGLIIVHTGSGKGKTTAALGTALRAAGNGLRVLVLQFLKGSWHYGELDSAPLSGIEIRQMGRGFVKVGGAEADPQDVEFVRVAWETAVREMRSGAWDLVVLDEILYAVGYGMLSEELILKELAERPEMLHVILTGRGAGKGLVDMANTVTEMREVKHAYSKGVEAQKGVEY